MRWPSFAHFVDSNLRGKFISCCSTSFRVACSSEFVRSDHLLSWIGSHVLLPTAHGNNSNNSSGGGSSSGSGGSSSGGGTGASGTSGTVASTATCAPALELSAELRRWELDFSQMEMQRACGRGSYGRVSLKCMARQLLVPVLHAKP